MVYVKSNAYIVIIISFTWQVKKTCTLEDI